MRFLLFFFLFASSIARAGNGDIINYGPTDSARLADEIDRARKAGVKIGMTVRQCLMAWGIPDHINETVTQYGRHQQWVYSSHRYLYFDNGILTVIQE